MVVYITLVFCLIHTYICTVDLTAYIVAHTFNANCPSAISAQTLVNAIESAASCSDTIRTES